MTTVRMADTGSSNRLIDVATSAMGGDRFTFDAGTTSAGGTYQGFSSDVDRSDYIKLVNTMLTNLGISQQVVEETVTTTKIGLK